MTEDEAVGQHHRLNGHEFEQIPGASLDPAESRGALPPPQFILFMEFSRQEY